jgi:hypothetical protein
LSLVSVQYFERSVGLFVKRFDSLSDNLFYL